MTTPRRYAATLAAFAAALAMTACGSGASITSSNPAAAEIDARSACANLNGWDPAATAQAMLTADKAAQGDKRYLILNLHVGEFARNLVKGTQEQTAAATPEDTAAAEQTLTASRTALAAALQTCKSFGLPGPQNQGIQQ